MKRYLMIILIVLCAPLWLPTSVRADGGGWPTATPTITPTSTQTLTPVPASVNVPPVLPTSYPAPGSMITPPSIGQQVNAAGTPAPTSTPTSTPAPTRLNTSASLTGGIACWPIAIIALVVGLVLFTWLRSGMRKSASN